jgi:hypothetical protein
MVENLIVRPKFRPFSTQVTISLSNFSCTTTAVILKDLSECRRFHTFQHFHWVCQILSDRFFHLAHSSDSL